MAEDRKFKWENGQFVNRVSGEPIPDDEPVIIFRARDVHAISVLQHYYSLVRDEHHEQAVWERLNEFIEFRQRFPERMKEPGVTRHIVLNSEREEGHEMNHEHERHPNNVDERVDRLEKEMKNVMADIDILNGILGGIATDATTLSQNLKAMEVELQQLQEAAANNQPVDLTNAILTARNAQAALDAMVTATSSAGVAPASTGTTSGATGGSDTGGTTSGATGGSGTAPTSADAGATGGSGASGAPSGTASTESGSDTSGATGGTSTDTGSGTSGAAGGDTGGSPTPPVAA